MSMKTATKRHAAKKRTANGKTGQRFMVMAGETIITIMAMTKKTARYEGARIKAFNPVRS